MGRNLQDYNADVNFFQKPLFARFSQAGVHMLRLLRPFLSITQPLETALVGLFFIQALRYLCGALYSQIAGASVLAALPSDLIPSGVPTPTTVQTEITLLGIWLGLPLLTLVLGRSRGLFIVAIAIMAVGRAWPLITAEAMTPFTSATLILGGGLIYIALMSRHRLSEFPFFFIFGLALDQIVRAFTNTLDPMYAPALQTPYLVAVVVLLLVGFINLRQKGVDGLMPLWSGPALGAMLFIELSLLALPNGVAGRAKADYTTLVPALIAATLLPIVPAIRAQARRFISLFDSAYRGWIWLVFIALLLVIGTRISGFIGATALVVAQFGISMTWWWLVRPKAEREMNLAGLGVLLSMVIFAIFYTLDIFTYEYAFVRDFAPPFTALNSVIPPLLRGLRGMGIGLILIAAFLALVPMIRTVRRIPWVGGAPSQTLFNTILVAGFSALGYIVAFPPLVTPTVNAEDLRIGTYNIHGGYDEFFRYRLEDMAITIQRSGASIILLQEVEMGRLTSYGVDQSLWLARRLGMDVRFFATNEGLQGLAVLSKAPIVYDDGVLLVSTGNQTGLQRVQVLPDDNVITIYNTWLSPLLAGEEVAPQESEQRRQLNQILSIIFNVHYPEGELGRAVLGGTFNTVPDSPLITFLQQETPFNDPFAGANPLLSYTFERTGVGRARLDYLWLWRQNLPEIGANVIFDSDASDHRLAFVGVQLRRAAP